MISDKINDTTEVELYIAQLKELNHLQKFSIDKWNNVINSMHLIGSITDGSLWYLLRST